MGAFIDLTGKVFGRLTVLSRVPNKKEGETLWDCVCVCGNHTITSTGRLRSGLCKSCGCLHKETAAAQGRATKKHGLTGTRLHRVWTNMKTRCYNKKNRNYARWGARGIYVCDEWFHDFSAFVAWAKQSGFSPDKQLDRIDNDGPYSPENCRWATPFEQAQNTRKTKHITFNGETLCLNEWARRLGIKPPTLCHRLQLYPVEVALIARVESGGGAIKAFGTKSAAN